MEKKTEGGKNSSHILPKNSMYRKLGECHFLAFLLQMFYGKHKIYSLKEKTSTFFVKKDKFSNTII